MGTQDAGRARGTERQMGFPRRISCSKYSRWAHSDLLTPLDPPRPAHSLGSTSPAFPNRPKSLRILSSLLSLLPRSHSQVSLQFARLPFPSCSFLLLPLSLLPARSSMFVSVLKRLPLCSNLKSHGNRSELNNGYLQCTLSPKLYMLSTELKVINIQFI